MMTFNLVFDVRAASAEEAIAAVLALKDSSWGKPGRTAADYGAPAASQQADGRWQVVLPAASPSAGKVVFEAAEAAGTSGGQIEFDLRASRPSGAATVTLPGTPVGPAGAPEAPAPPPPASAPAAPAPAPAAPAPQAPTPPPPAPAPQAPAPPPQAPAPPPAAPAPAPPPPAPAPAAPAPAAAPQAPAPPPPPPPPAPAPAPAAPAAPAPAPPPQAPAPPPPQPQAPAPPPGPPPGPPGPPGAPPGPPGPPMAPMGGPAMRGPFHPTHVVSGRGTPAWDQPDPTKPSAQVLAPWREVQVVDQIGAWANVVTNDGWEGWCDVHALMPRAGGRRR